jgi:hypothetical protein
LALGTGSTIGALVTPTVVAVFSWQFALAAWALLAVVAVNMWQRAPRSSMVFMARALNPRQLFHSRVAWHLTLYFGLVSTLTFLIMGWLPAILRDAGISASYAGFCLALSMAMGLPMMWLVPFGIHRMRRPGILVILLAVLNGVGVAGLLVAPAVTPWLWSTGLGLGMGGLAMALTLISVRAAGNPDITTALSGMVQGLGYFIAGAGALACGLVHSATGSWKLPLIMALFVLAGQVWCGVRATRPILVAPKPIAELEPTKPKPDLTRRNLKPAWTGEPLTNGTRGTAKSELGPAVPDLAHLGNGTRMTTVSEPKPATNGALVTAMANQAIGPDVTQPISGVWVAAIADLESVKSETNLTQLSDGAWVIANADLERLANGAQLAALSGPQPAKPEQDTAHLANGVRVTASAESEADTAKSGNGVPVGAMPTPGKRERVLPHLVNGVWIAGPVESELAAAALADGAPGAASAEPDLALTNGVRVTAVSESDAVEAEPDIWGPELIDLPGGVWVRSTAVPEHQFNDMRVTAVSRPERDVTHLVSNGVGVAGSEPDATDLPDGVAVAASVGPEPADLAHLSNGVRVTAKADSEQLINGVRVTAVSEPERDATWLVDNGVRAGAEPGAMDTPDGVRVAAVSGQGPGSRWIPFTNGAGIPVPRPSEPELPRPVNGVTAKVPPEHLANGVRVTAVGGQGGGSPAEPAPGLPRPVNGVRVTRLANGVRVNAMGVQGLGSRWIPFTNGAGIPVPRPAEPDLPQPADGGPESDLAHAASGVRVTAQSEPDLSQVADDVPEHLSQDVVATALVEIPLPRQPIGPQSGAPIVQSVQPETATQEG